MTDLNLERHFNVSPEIVYEHITKQEHLKNWMGPATMHCIEIDMNLVTGAHWYAIIENSEGQKYKMSGKVLDTDPPKTVDFTWGWHDETDARGHESNVRFQVASDGADGSIFKLIHTNLPRYVQDGFGERNC